VKFREITIRLAICLHGGFQQPAQHATGQSDGSIGSPKRRHATYGIFHLFEEKAMSTLNLAAHSSGPLASGSKLVAFILVSHPERARAFYEGTLGLRFLMNDGFALVFEHAGTMIRAGMAETVNASQNTVLGWEVEDISAAVERLRAAGVKFRQVRSRNQDDSPIWTAADGSKVAWFRDPDGNWLSISKHAYSAGEL
jgi:catechol 2,3-dioxygenase-like lactoylglutathione lyase family enzyme